MDKTYTILQVTNRLPYPLNDGGNIATYHVTKYLHKFGHRVVLASINTKKHHQDPAKLSTIATVKTVDLDTTITLAGLLKGVFQKTPYNIARFDSEAFKTILEKIIQEEKPSVIQLEGIYLATYAEAIKKKSSAPLVLRSHNIEHEIWERTAQNETNILKKIYLKHLSKKIRLFEQEHMHLFDGIIAITERDKMFYQNNNYKGLLKTIPAGVDLEQLSPTKPRRSELSLCFLGSMEWMPNVQGIDWYLEKVWPILHQKYSTLTLHIAGKGMSDEMKARKIPGVIFHGMVPDAAAFLDEHAVMIVPLLSGGGMRLKIVEAMAHRQCVLSTSVGAEGIDAVNEKEILLADTPKAFVEKTEALLNGTFNAETIGQQAEKLVQEKYSWEKLVREIEKFYLDLI
ncbi:MAG TPA: glycosyltransferase family 4 protein [Cytophagaceae bacterium]|nr:glycosyltransferase family 4 protein [Cytophagaceae bacterium]